MLMMTQPHMHCKTATVEEENDGPEDEGTHDTVSFTRTLIVEVAILI